MDIQFNKEYHVLLFTFCLCSQCSHMGFITSIVKVGVQIHYIAKRFQCSLEVPIDSQGQISVSTVALSCIMMSWRGGSGPYDSWHARHYNINTPPQAQHTRTPHQHGEEPPSPQGTKRYDRDLPSTFQPDSQHFDTKQQFGLMFPRHITATAWSQKYQLAGRSIETIHLHELVYMGWSNWNIRALANGKFTSLVFARSIIESIFFHHLSIKLRDEHVDLDDIAAAHCDQQGITITDPDPNQLKKTKIHHLVNATMDYFHQFANTSLQDAQAKIRALEQQLQAQRHTTSNNQLPVVDAQEQDLTMTPESTTTPQANHDQHTPPTAPNKRTIPTTNAAQPATKKPRTWTDMGIKARSAGHTTSPPHNITPSSAGDTIPASTITDLQDNIHNLPGTNAIRPFTTAAPNTIAAKTVDAWIKKQPVPKQHQAALHDALRTLHELLKKVPKAEQSTLQIKQHHLACRWRWRHRRAMKSSTSCCCLRLRSLSD